MTADRTTKLALLWIAVMLTILAADKLVQTRLAFAEDKQAPNVQLIVNEPLEIMITEPVKTKIVEWSTYPSQPVKVKIDDPWPAKVEIKDEVKVTGELRLKD
ncbi:hypothetical protein AMJ87_01920 [candidate division WOR_3 bacterium SM23_60]|uniref:Uncharacterized protein n=1 Tax=candidate division WOR_3 bacterium SM23_60 TaxID=1703780 RepID=A0A0S8GKN9_UNCW3|nr:MAG: hypothetical protein AMJ87_01920 [candidate division WOR_3 bacterium SM23_60]